MSAEPPAARHGGPADEEQHERTDADHLDSVEDGCGCTEIWEHLSEQRGEAASD